MEELERQYLQSRVEVQEATLTTVGKELHDNIGQLLSSAKMLLGVAQRSSGNVEQVVKKVDEILNQIIENIRDLSKSLDGDYLKRFNLIENVAIEANRNNEINPNLRIHFSSVEHLPLEPEDQIVLFRIIQEGISNAIKHANAANIFISISQPDKELYITITDDGQGFDINTVTKGIGLTSMIIRATSLSGTIQWNQLYPGTELRITISKLKT